MAGGPGRRPLAIALIALALGTAACGGRFVEPPNERAAGGHVPAGTTVTPSGAVPGSGSTATSSTPTESPPTGSSKAAVPQIPGRAGPSPQDAVTQAYESYLVDLSGLDDTLSKGYVAPLASVTTTRLAQATVRQAAALQSAHEHGVGTLRDDHLAITMTGATTAALVDCQDEDHFYLVSDDSGTPDPFVARGYFVGSAQLVLSDGQWLVDTFTTTHVSCTF